jgi:hypothetical protein
LPAATAASHAHAATGIVGFFERHGPLVRAVADAAGTDEEIERGYSGFVETFVDMTRGDAAPGDRLTRRRAA